MCPWLQLSQLLHLHRQAPDGAAVEQRARRRVPPAQQAGVQGLQQGHRHHAHQRQEGEGGVELSAGQRKISWFSMYTRHYATHQRPWYWGQVGQAQPLFLTKQPEGNQKLALTRQPKSKM